jgi:phosphoenolpyruvate carboxykinase (GTP)
MKWIFERCEGTAAAVDTPIGKLPAEGALDLRGLNVSPAAMTELLRVDTTGWKAELPSIGEHFATFGTRIPQALFEELSELEGRLG